MKCQEKKLCWRNNHTVTVYMIRRDSFSLFLQSFVRSSFFYGTSCFLSRWLNKIATLLSFPKLFKSFTPYNIITSCQISITKSESRILDLPPYLTVEFSAVDALLPPQNTQNIENYTVAAVILMWNVHYSAHLPTTV